jgi:hypothetical protein
MFDAPGPTLRLTAVSGLARGRLDPEVLDELSAVELGKNQTLLEAARRRAVRLAPAAWAGDFDRGLGRLAELQAVYPEALAGVLAMPQVGAWAVDCLRRTAAGAAPDLAYLSGLTASASVSAGLPCRLADLADHGLLPGLGLFSGGCWRPVPVLRTRAYGLRLAVRLDFLDPYLSGYGRRLPADPAHWTARLAGTWEILAARHRQEAEAMVAVLTTIVPLAATRTGGSVSVTSGCAFGAVALSAPSDPYAFAATLVHELRHLLLGAVEDLTALADPGDPRLFYAPWRLDARPLGALLQGCFAHAAVAGFWRQEYRSGPDEIRARAEAEFAYRRRATADATDTAIESGGLTPAGLLVARGIAAALRPWLEEPVSPEADRKAASRRAEHLARWSHTNPGRTP